MLRHLVLLACFLTVPSVMAQPTPPAAGKAANQPDPIQLMDECREALSRVDALSYEATVEGSGGLEIPKITARVSMAKADAGGWKVYAKGAAGAQAFEVSYDGAEAYSLREADKVMFQKTPRDLTDLMVFFGTQSAKHPIVWELIDDSPLPLPIGAAFHLGEETIDGQACEKVRVPSAGKNDAAPDADHGYTVWIARSDKLPRRIERHVGINGAQSRVLTLADLKINGESIGAPYSLPVPSGFAVRNPDAGQRRARMAGEMERPQRRSRGLAAGDMAPEFFLNDAKGKEHKLSDYRGKVVVLDFWATWCPPCRDAMPGIQRLHEKFKGRPVEVIGISFNDHGDPVAFMQQQKFTYGLLLGGEVLAQKYGVSGIPHFFIIGKDGRILWTAVGHRPGHEREMAEVIEKALAEDQP
jgi:peroxiredoxin